MPACWHFQDNAGQHIQSNQDNVITTFHKLVSLPSSPVSTVWADAGKVNIRARPSTS